MYLLKFLKLSELSQKFIILFFQLLGPTIFLLIMVGLSVVFFNFTKILLKKVKRNLEKKSLVINKKDCERPYLLEMMDNVSTIVDGFWILFNSLLLVVNVLVIICSIILTIIQRNIFYANYIAMLIIIAELAYGHLEFSKATGLYLDFNFIKSLNYSFLCKMVFKILIGIAAIASVIELFSDKVMIKFQSFIHISLLLGIGLILYALIELLENLMGRVRLYKNNIYRYEKHRKKSIAENEIENKTTSRTRNFKSESSLNFVSKLTVTLTLTLGISLLLNLKAKESSAIEPKTPLEYPTNRKNQNNINNKLEEILSVEKKIKNSEKIQTNKYNDSSKRNIYNIKKIVICTEDKPKSKQKHHKNGPVFQDPRNKRLPATGEK